MNTRPSIVLFTDLDGTLLDALTYDPGPSVPALDRCRKLGIPVVFVSSKTRAEMERLRAALGNTDPFASENGGGLFLPAETWPDPPGVGQYEIERDGGFWRITLGAPYDRVARDLAAAAGAAGAWVRGLDTMSETEAADLTGLAPEEARLAVRREFDIPFLIIDETEAVVDRLRAEIEARGLCYTRGGRFHHILGRSDKGRAVSLLEELCREASPGARFAAVGDAANDGPMLREADHPYLVRRPDGTFDQDAWFDGLTVTKGIGPEGFAEAVRAVAALVEGEGIT